MSSVGGAFACLGLTAEPLQCYDVLRHSEVNRCLILCAATLVYPFIAVTRLNWTVVSVFAPVT